MNYSEKLIEILSTIFDKEVDESCSYQTEELWDSITHLEIIVTVEEEFDIKIPKDKIAELKSYNDLLSMIKELQTY